MDPVLIFILLGIGFFIIKRILSGPERRSSYPEKKNNQIKKEKADSFEKKSKRPEEEKKWKIVGTKREKIEGHAINVS